MLTSWVHMYPHESPPLSHFSLLHASPSSTSPKLRRPSPPQRRCGRRMAGRRPNDSRLRGQAVASKRGRGEAAASMRAWCTWIRVATTARERDEATCIGGSGASRHGLSLAGAEARSGGSTSTGGTQGGLTGQLDSG
ncbi:hypothetical protein BS78_02G105800 [Paspalum vaginatum]|nr:hypothetical protein BS78_02G105800 [Paspalum vaginatum]